MIPKLTDDAVAELPLGAGRAELLEEIMSTVAPDRIAPADHPAPKRRGLLIPLAAAAVVGAIAVSSLWWHDGLGSDKDGVSSVAIQEQPDSEFRAVLDAPGWRVSATEDSDGYGEVDYAKAGASFQITWYSASSYEDYVTDREHIVDPPAAGEPVQVLGRSGQLWAYTSDDHTVIREVENGHWMEFRGSGMDAAAYRSLLGELRLVGLTDYESALPRSYIGTGERVDSANAMIAGITDVSGAGWPGGQAPSLESSQQDPYQLGAEIAGRYACAWIDEFVAAQTAGDAGRETQAARVLGTSRQWPILRQMNAKGDYPEVVWEYADDVAAGRVPEGYRSGLGCP